MAQLPFQPISFLKNITHRGIEGDNFQECSALFIYILTSFVLKQGLAKYLDRKVPKIESMLDSSFKNQ